MPPSRILPLLLMLINPLIQMNLDIVKLEKNHFFLKNGKTVKVNLMLGF